MDFLVLLLIVAIAAVVAYLKVPKFKEAVDRVANHRQKPTSTEVSPQPPPIPNSGANVPNLGAPVAPTATTVAPAATNVPAPGQSYVEWYNAQPPHVRAIYPNPDDAAYRDQQAAIFRQNQQAQLTAQDGQIVPVGTGGFMVTGEKITVHGVHRGTLEVSVSPKSPAGAVFVSLNSHRESGLSGVVQFREVVDGEFSLTVEHSGRASSWVVLNPL